jgi:tetratricopeptide (TPR) repeat protein
MFDDEDEEIHDGDVSGDLAMLDRMYEQNDYGYFDADRVEAMIDHLLVTNQFKKARWASEMAFQHFPYNNLFKLRQAQSMSLMGDIKEALKILLYLEKTDLPSLDLYLSLASSFSQLRDSESAIKYFKRSLEFAEDEEKPDIYMDIAMEYESTKDYQNAIRVLQTAIIEYPKNESLVYELAFCFDQIKEYQRSIDCFVKFLDEDPYSYTAWYNLGNAYVRKQDYENALQAYDYCIVINEDFVPAYYNIGNTYVELENYEKAITFYQKCIGFGGDDAMTYCSLGECYEELEKYDEALHYYDKCLSLLPQFADAWLGKSIVFEALDDVSRAISAVKTAIEIDGENSGYYHVLAGIYQKHGDIDLARSAFEQALKFSESEDENLIIDYLKLMHDDFPDELYEVIELNELLAKSDVTNLFLVYAFWQLNKRVGALAILDELLISNRTLAKKLFIHFEELSQFPDLLSRLED